MKVRHEHAPHRAAAEVRGEDALPQGARVVEADARVDDGPAVAVIQEPQIDVIELERQGHAQPGDPGSDRADVGGRGRFRPRMIERHALQCTLRSRAEPDLLCAAVTPCSAIDGCALPSRIGGHRMSLPRLAAVAVTLAMLSGAELAHAQLLLSTNDNKVALVNGVATVVKSQPPDTLTVIDIKSWPPKVVAELDVPGSVVGPPL